MKIKIGRVRNGWRLSVDFKYKAYNPFALCWFSDIKTLRIEMPNCATYGIGLHAELV